MKQSYVTQGSYQGLQIQQNLYSLCNLNVEVASYLEFYVIEYKLIEKLYVYHCEKKNSVCVCGKMQLFNFDKDIFDNKLFLIFYSN